MPVATALAFFSATGTGTISNAQAGTSASTVSITQQPGFTYAGPSTTTLVPGGTVTFTQVTACTAGPPCVVPSLGLASWTSNKAGCDSTTMPGSFTITNQNWTVNLPVTLATVGASDSDIVTITWNNLAISQTACAGGLFAFVLAVP
jgi:hypothetical protein